MALNDTILNIGNAAMQSAMTHASIHSAADTESSAGRQAITWQTAANGDMVITTALNFTGGASSGAATRIGFYSAGSGGTYYGEQALTGDQTFNAAGEYTVTGVTITGTAS
jgi:hypothetical protein